MMMKEFRIPMPMTVAEYQIAQLYTVMETSKSETGGGDGVEEVISQPFVDCDLGNFGVQSGHYTQKKYHLDQYANIKVPMYVRLLTPRGCLQLQEDSWNAYPYCKTVLTNDYLNERFIITIESVHLPDRGETENALNLPPEKLIQREVVFIDIAKDLGQEEETCITTGKLEGARSTKTGRGPLIDDWYIDCNPVMTCYKLVTVEVKIFGLQTRMEAFTMNNQKRVMIAFHRRMFMCMDDWYTLNMNDIRRLEILAKEELEQQRKFGEHRGSRCEE